MRALRPQALFPFNHVDRIDTGDAFTGALIF
jgi:hypothetical protein